MLVKYCRREKREEEKREKKRKERRREKREEEKREKKWYVKYIKEKGKKSKISHCRIGENVKEKNDRTGKSKNLLE